MDTAIRVCQENLRNANERLMIATNTMDRCQSEKAVEIELNDELKDKNNGLISKNQKQTRKTKRNRGIALGVTIVAIIEGVLLWVSK